MALYSFSLAGLTDWLDGFIARNFSKPSDLGRYLDPIADKILLITVVSALTFFEKISPTVFYIIIARDIIILFGCLFIIFSASKIELKPSTMGKICTFTQIFMCMFVIANLALGQKFKICDTLVNIIIPITLATTALSGLSYVRIFYKHYQAK